MAQEASENHQSLLTLGGYERDDESIFDQNKLNFTAFRVASESSWSLKLNKIGFRLGLFIPSKRYAIIDTATSQFSMPTGDIDRFFRMICNRVQFMDVECEIRE